YRCVYRCVYVISKAQIEAEEVAARGGIGRHVLAPLHLRRADEVDFGIEPGVRGPDEEVPPLEREAGRANAATGPAEQPLWKRVAQRELTKLDEGGRLEVRRPTGVVLSVSFGAERRIGEQPLTDVELDVSEVPDSAAPGPNDESSGVEGAEGQLVVEVHDVGRQSVADLNRGSVRAVALADDFRYRSPNLHPERTEVAAAAILQREGRHRE